MTTEAEVRQAPHPATRTAAEWSLIHARAVREGTDGSPDDQAALIACAYWRIRRVVNDTRPVIGDGAADLLMAALDEHASSWAVAS